MSSSLKHYTQGDQENTNKGPTDGRQKLIDTKNKVQNKRKEFSKKCSAKMAELTHNITYSMAKRPLTHCLAYWGILMGMLLIVVVGGYLELAQLLQQDFQIISITDVRNEFALKAANDLARESGDLLLEVDFRNTSLNTFSFFFLYEIENEEANLFTPENVQIMCESEAAILAQSDYKLYCPTGEENLGFLTECTEGSFVLSTFFYEDLAAQIILNEVGDVQNDNDFELCPLKTEEEVARSAAFLLSLNQVSRFVDNPVKPTLGRSVVNLAGPLGPDSPPNEVFEQTETIFLGDQAEGGYKIPTSAFKDLILSFVGARDFDRSRFSPSGGTIKTLVHGFYLSFLEFQAVVQSDTLLALGSFGVVTTLVIIYTRSVFFGLLAMISVVLSMPAGLFLYSVVFRIIYFNNLHILVLFIIMGIGADNIFVLFDAWRQSEAAIREEIEDEQKRGGGLEFKAKSLNNDEKQESKHPSRYELGVNESVEEKETELKGFALEDDNKNIPSLEEEDGLAQLEQEDFEFLRRRVHFTYTRSILSVSHTAITTFLAFIATSVSKINPIAAFGLFAGFVILMNLIFMTNILPATLVTYHVYIERRWKNRKEIKKDNQQKQTPDKPKKKNFVTKGLEKYIYLMNNTKFPFLCLAFTYSLGISLTIYALRLETPTSVESNFRKDHMFTIFQDIFRNSFNAQDEDQLADVTAVFGISELDDSGVQKFSTDPFRGNPVFNEDFEIVTEESQEFLKFFCDEIIQEPCLEEVCTDGALVFQKSVIDGCWINDFQEWNQENFPNSTTFVNGEDNLSAEEVIDKLTVYVQTEGKDFLSDIGSINGEIKFVTIRYKMTMRKDQPLKIKKPVLQLFNDFTESIRSEEDVPPGMETLYQTGFDFTWQHTEEALVSGLYSGMAISLMVSFLVVLAGTRSVIVSAFAIAGVATIVMCVLGTIQRMGFELGTAEALAGVMVIGLAVDYTVHLGHMFVHAKHYFSEHNLEDLNKEKDLADFNSRMLVSMASMRSMSLIVAPEKLREELKLDKQVYNSDLIFYAVDKMGMTVLAGAITTFMSAVFLLATTLAFFGKMAVLIGLTVMYSTIYAFLFFIPMLRVFGPGKKGKKPDNGQNEEEGDTKAKSQTI